MKKVGEWCYTHFVLVRAVAVRFEKWHADEYGESKSCKEQALEKCHYSHRVVEGKWINMVGWPKVEVKKKK